MQRLLGALLLGVVFLCGSLRAQVNIAWGRTFGAPGGRGVSAADGGVYVSANTGVTGFVLKYDLNGNELWTRQVGAGSSASVFTSASSVSAVANGVYVGGTATGPLPGQTWLGGMDEGAFVSKYDPNGNELWTREFGSPSDNVGDGENNTSVWGVGAAVDGVYVAGATTGALPGQTHIGSIYGNYNSFLSKYDLNGNELWTRQFGSICNDYASSVSVGSDGIYVAGGTGPDAYVSKYDINGNLLWSSQLGPPLNCDQGPTTFGNSVSATSDGVYVGGGTASSLLGQPYIGPADDAFLSKFDLSGNEVWTREFLGMLNYSGGAWAVSATAAGVWVPYQDGYISQYDPLGNLVANSSSLAAHGLMAAVDASSGIVYVTGTVVFAPSPIQPIIQGFLAMLTSVPDTTPPVSQVSPLPGAETSTNFLVQWSGTDTGSGILDYTIYVSDNGGPFNFWIDTNATQAWYPGFLGHVYGFFSQALDWAGNVENLKSAAEASTLTPARSAEDVNGDGQINCADVELVQTSFGKKTGQPGFNPAADVNKDGVVNVLDLALVTQKLIPGTTCP
jgi:hypothetical protein